MIKLTKHYYFDGSRWMLIGFCFGIVFGLFGISVSIIGILTPNFEETLAGTVILSIFTVVIIGFFIGLAIYLFYNMYKLAGLWFK